MNDPRNKPHPTVRLGIFIVVVVLLVIGTLLYNLITGKREYERENAPAAAPATPAASVASAVTAPSGNGSGQ